MVQQVQSAETVYSMQHTVVDISSSESIRHQMNYYLPVEKCAFSKDIFPGLSRSWNFKEEKIQDFPGGVGTLFDPWYQSGSYATEGQKTIMIEVVLKLGI